MDWVTTHDLDKWSGSRDSQEKLPEIIRRLVHATVKDATKCRFPSGEAIGMRGWDGILEVGTITHQCLPAGLSVWELGTAYGQKIRTMIKLLKHLDLICTNLLPLNRSFTHYTG